MTKHWTNKNKQAGINSFGFGGTNAHMVVQNYDKNQPQAKSNAPVKLQPMSIIGMDAHFGDCTNLEDFYSTIYNGKQHFQDLPKGRWKGFDENKNLLQRFGFEDGKAPKGAYIEDFEIDLLRYKIQPKEAETLEPQQALILKVADNAIKDGIATPMIIVMPDANTKRRGYSNDITGEWRSEDFFIKELKCCKINRILWKNSNAICIVAFPQISHTFLLKNITKSAIWNKIILLLYFP